MIGLPQRPLSARRPQLILPRQGCSNATNGEASLESHGRAWLLGIRVFVPQGASISVARSGDVDSAFAHNPVAYPPVALADMDADEISSERIIHQPPSCIEFCPANSSIFVVGTYKLDERQESNNAEGTTSQWRSGRVEVYQIRRQNLSPEFGVSQCIDKYDFPDCAVLDLHFWSQDHTFFAVCTSTSQIIFLRLEGVEHDSAERSIQPSLSLSKAGSLQIGQDDTVLATSFAWNPQPTTIDSDLISVAVAFSSGEVKLLTIWRETKSESGGHYDFHILFEASIDAAHTLEAWSVAFADLSSSEKHETILLTGGDDSTLACHSIKTDLDSGAVSPAQIFRDYKTHTAGVTAILPILDANQVSPGTRTFVTGSYDEHLRVFTMEECLPYKRKVVVDISLGGGVWRLGKLSESLRQDCEGGHVCSVLILASCMHAGVRIIRIIRRQPKQEGENWCTWEIDVIGQFIKGHESMCYGADCVSVQALPGSQATDLMSCRQQSGSPHHDEDPRRDFVVVSTSFYDKKICVWSFHDEMTTVNKVEADPKADQESCREKAYRAEEGNGRD